MVSRTPSFGRRDQRPMIVIGTVAGVLAIAVVLGLLFVNRKPAPVHHVPDVVAVIVSGPSSITQQADFQALLGYAASKGDVIAIASARHPDVAQGVSLALIGINDLERQGNQESAKKKAEALYQAAAAPGGTADLQQSFNTIYDFLHTVSHDRVWVAALGPVNEVAQGVDLVDPVDRGDPSSSISSFQGGYVQSCSGWDLNVAEGVVQPSELAEDQVREYWRQLMRSCGGQLTAWTIHLSEFPSTTAVAPWSGGGRCGITYELGGQTLFDTGEYQLLPSADQTLDRILARVESAQKPHLHIDGYTDSQGTSSYNQILSENRAQAVASWFTERGIDNSQVTVQGHGEADPTATNGTAQGRQLNRRVEITLTYSGCSQG
jgi:outer membrane protein OmpA-like peptidoglycan-associated protein